MQIDSNGIKTMHKFKKWMQIDVLGVCEPDVADPGLEDV